MGRCPMLVWGGPLALNSPPLFAAWSSGRSWVRRDRAGFAGGGGTVGEFGIPARELSTPNFTELKSFPGSPPVPAKFRLQKGENRG